MLSKENYKRRTEAAEVAKVIDVIVSYGAAQATTNENIREQ
jgi:hypothetical protein